MTNEERDLISQFVARVGGNAGGRGMFASSVPSTQPSLPPIDPEADRFIADQFASHPEARYRITQMAVVQEAALAEAASRMQKMQAELEQMRQQAQQMQQSAPSGQPQSRGFLGKLFGGGAAPQPPPNQQSPWNQGSAQPRYAPPPQPYRAAISTQHAAWDVPALRLRLPRIGLDDGGRRGWRRGGRQSADGHVLRPWRGRWIRRRHGWGSASAVLRAKPPSSTITAITARPLGWGGAPPRRIGAMPPRTAGRQRFHG